MSSHPIVALTRCTHDSTDDAVAAKVRETIELAGGIPEKVRRARRILVKPNFVGANGRLDHEIKRHQGRLVSCAEPIVTHTVVAAIREANPGAEILLAEGIDVQAGRSPDEIFRNMDATRLVDEFGVRLIDGNTGDLTLVPVPGGGLIHKHVWLNRELTNVDAVVSVAKLKCHGAAGVTMSLKNMFGLLPRSKYGGRYRGFMHTNYFRLMRIVTDIATTLKPDLAVVDGLIASDHGMDHAPVVMDLMLAGHDPVATDAVGAAALGFDPEADFPTEPFLHSDNHLRLAARAGVGVLAFANTEIRGLTLTEARRHRFSLELEISITPDQACAARAAAIEQAAVFQAKRTDLLERYAGQYVYLHQGKVLWSTDSLPDATERALAHLPKSEYGLAIQVVPEDQEVERATAYA